MSSETEVNIAIVTGLVCGPGSIIWLLIAPRLLYKGVNPVYIGLGTLLIILILLAIFVF